MADLIIATRAPHASSINDLARDGKITPIEFTSPVDGIRRKANSVWAAHDWLQDHGGYANPNKAPIWHL